MELKTDKKFGITLVELIIALTMVSILMVMMFGVIFKKTKASIMTPSGTFYCWKDWNGKLYQMTVASKGAKTEKEAPHEVKGDSCFLDFPKIVTKEVNNIKAFIIGGGAAGDFYSNLSMEEISDVGLTEQIKNDVKCFEVDTQSKCILYHYEEGAKEYMACLDDERGDLPDTSNFIGSAAYNNKVLGKCVIELLDYDKKPTKYIVNASADQLAKYHYNPGNSDSTDCNMDSSRTNSTYDFYPYLSYVGTGGQIELVQPNSSLLTRVDDNNIKYKMASKVKYQKLSSSTKNEFISVDTTNLFDLNQPLSIKKDDIGNPGVYRAGCSEPNCGSGGATVLRSHIDPNKIVAEAKGAQYIVRAKGSDKLSNDLDMPEVKKSIRSGGSPLVYSTCCDGQNQKCNLEKIDTKLGDFIGLNNPEIPKMNYICDGTKKAPVEISYGDDNTGFGLFGYNGAPNDCIYKYYPYKELKAYGANIQKTQPSDNSPNNCSKSGPGHGMGGAIIIKWN